MTQADEEIELCRDIQMKLPDCLWALDEKTRYVKGRYNKDFAAYEEDSFFVFGVVEVPLKDEDDVFTWGLWVQVHKNVHDRMLDEFQTKEALGRHYQGYIANEVPFYPDAFGALVDIYTFENRRPEIIVQDGSLAVDQKEGLSRHRHKALDEELFGDDEEDGAEDFEE